ncbi:hypothetical protein GGQ80_003671 [Sphingomonas jinjuensis]|uniref:Uncharacterized protein n=1 Tax=Sphingomonas jinjuensis TaxID=535907 RepID=A0A840FHU4_9SPHN|nr:hypothetical protein [Sphingomonas jinjuensis]MBB4155746.1 hypothetical protein [Sphingomonas jinjuensis]
MKRPILLLLIASVAADPAPAADDKPPPAPPNAIVYMGSCVSPALNGPAAQDDKDQAAFASIVGAAVPSLIGSGLDWIGTQLSALGEDRKTTVFGSRSSEVPVRERTCLQIARSAAGGRTLRSLLDAQDGWTAALQRTTNRQGWTAPAVPLDGPIDFFAEFWVRPSNGGEAISFTPTLLYYPRQLTRRGNGKLESAIVVSVKLSASSDAGASASWPFPLQRPNETLQVLIPPRRTETAVERVRSGELTRLCETLCELSSPWIGNPWAGAAKAGDAAGSRLAAGVGPGANGVVGPRATTVRIEITEIRSGSAFFKALGAAFTAAKPAIRSGLEEAIIPARRAEANTAATAASATALTVYATKLDEAETARRDKYCAANGKAGANWTSLSAQLRAKELLANVAADAAGVARPFPTPIDVGGALDASRCP